MTQSERAKNVFVIHTERAPIEQQYFSALQEVFADGPLTVWNYDDWSWETLQRDSRKKVYAREGLRIDPVRWMLKSPKPFIRRGTSLQVAKATLRRILRDSSVVIFVEPTQGRPSEGVEFELTELRRIMDDAIKPHPRPATIQVILEPVRPVLTYASPIDLSRWRTSCYLGLSAGKHASAAQVRDFAAATAFATVITHFMNRMPYQADPALAHRILQRTINRAYPITVFGTGIQDPSYLAAAQAEYQTLDEMRVAEFRTQWRELMSFASKARAYIKILEAQFGQSETEVVWPFMYHPKTSSCAEFFELIHQPFDEVVDRAPQIMEEELARHHRFPPDATVCELDLEAFDPDSLTRLSMAISALLRQEGSRWDEEACKAVQAVFGWCGNNLPPQSLAAALSVMSILHDPPRAVQQLVEAFLTFAYVVLRHFRYQDASQQPNWYNHFFGEAIIELLSTLRTGDLGLVNSAQFHQLDALVAQCFRNSVRWSD